LAKNIAKPANIFQDYQSISSTKANFDEVYIQKDPRYYYQTFGKLDYVIPDVAFSIFQQIVSHLKLIKNKPITILDLGCSYGNNAALLRYKLKFSQLFNRYNFLKGLDASEIIHLDKHYFNSWPADNDIKFIGLDISENALTYAQKTGLITDYICVNLEEKELTPHQQSILKYVDLIISTGCVGYVTEKTFQKIMACFDQENVPWVSSFVLRMFPFNSIIKSLNKYGLNTEKLKGTTFLQRRFESQVEMDDVIKSLRSQKISTKGKETNGFLHTEFFLSRPQKSIDTKVISDIVSVTTGVSKLYHHQRIV
jgi:SAM-dependent methyltransferase